MVLSLETVNFVLTLVGHAGHSVMVLSVQLIQAELVCGVDFLNSLHVLLLALSGTLLETLDLRPEGISLSNELLLVAAVLISILSDFDGGVSDVGLQLTALYLGVTEEFLVHKYILFEIIDDLKI